VQDVSETSDYNDSDLDALDTYACPNDYDAAEVLGDIDPDVESHDDETFETLLFTATNPDGTVSVTALMNGEILRVTLSAAVTSMTEPSLAEEILVLASMSRLQALAGQHALIAALMGRLGRDPAETHSFLERDLRLPSPTSINETRAKVFAARYYSEPE
jgi:hypothetical protein